MADTAKSRLRNNAYIFQPGEHVWVNSTFFDDPKVPVEERYSVLLGGDGRCPGIVRKRMGCSYMIDFDDDSTASVPAIEVMPTKREREQRIADQNDPSDSDDEDYYPHDEEAEFEDIEPGSDDDDSSPKEKLFYLKDGNSDIFIGKLHPGAKIVHNVPLVGSQRRFEILSLINTSNWPQFDVERHQIGSFIAWDLKDSELKVKARRPEAGLEQIIPQNVLEKYKNHKTMGCQAVCGVACLLTEDKVYHEWITLTEAEAEKTPTKKRKRTLGNQKEIRKNLRLEGKEYFTKKGKKVQARQPMTWVACKCKAQCAENVDLVDRNKMYENYYNIKSLDERRQFINSMISSEEPKQRTTGKAISRRKRTLVYHLNKTNGDKVVVCAKVFFSTMQVTRKFVRCTVDNSVQGFSKSDLRGKTTVPKHKLSVDQSNRIIAHIHSFPKVPSHYCRKKQLKSKKNDKPIMYVEDTTNFSSLTWTKMHNLYQQKCKEDGVQDPVGISTYKKFIKSENVKIHKPKNDQCKICTKYKRSTPEEKEKGKLKQQTHIGNNHKVMELKEEYKTEAKENDKMLVFNFDLEAVLYTPCDKVSTIYYKRKLCTYNCTTFNLVTKTGNCYMWNETEGKRGSDEIGSILYRYLSSFNGEEVVMFSDTCGGQNRNQYVAIVLNHIVETHPNIKSIDYLFMVQGHSHMEVDNMHAAIERKSSRLQVYDPYGWAVVSSIARKNPYIVEQLKFTDFFDLKTLKKDRKVTNVTKDTEGEKVRWKDDGSIAWMRFEKANPNKIFYKTTYNKNDKFKEIEITRVTKRVSRQTSAVELKPVYSARMPVSKAKVKDLLELCSDLTIPSQYHSFYENLKTLEQESDASDDDSESDSSDGTIDSDNDDNGGVDD